MSFSHRLSLQFLGAAQTVTGSRTKLNFDGFSTLIDCGLFQGPKELRKRNWEKLENVKSIDAVVLTHAHIDHSGYLPKMAKDGFRGPVYCSEATYDLCEIMLRDAAHLQEEDARFLGTHNLSHYKPPRPLYTKQHAELALRLFKPIPLNKWTDIGPGVSLRLLRAGHILGSTIVQFAMDRSNGVEIITFSGDLGNNYQHMIKGPVTVKETDHLILEGTYGDRTIERKNIIDQLEEVVNNSYKNKGVLLIPAFAVGRTQEILFLLTKLNREGRIPDVPIYVDSPMANKTTDLFSEHLGDLKPYFKESVLTYPLATPIFKAVRMAEDSIRLCNRKGPMIVVSASGMLAGGRILHHLRARLSDPANTVLFVGYQAEETKGRLLQSGLKKIRIHKQFVDVAAKIETIDGLSAHADSDEILSWVGRMQKKPKSIFLNHGRYEALRCLQYRLKTELGIMASIPEAHEKFNL